MRCSVFCHIWAAEGYEKVFLIFIRTSAELEMIFSAFYIFYISFILSLFDASEISEGESPKKPALINIQSRDGASICYSATQMTWV